MEFRWGLRWAAVVVLLCVNGLAEVGREGQVLVLVYDHARIPATVLEQAGQEAVRIFRKADVDLQWVNCSKQSTRDECRALTDQKELVVNVIPKGSSASDSVYGDAFLAEDGSGRYADIFFDRITEAHRNCGVSESRLLGGVAAHEIGHLLLGLRAHSLLGIMSPRWSSEHIKQLQMGMLLFTSEQARRMGDHSNPDAFAKSYASPPNLSDGLHALVETRECSGTLLACRP